jgi:hypothetical protein
MILRPGHSKDVSNHFLGGGVGRRTSCAKQSQRMSRYQLLHGWRGDMK